MTTITATELKTNFKHIGNIVSNGGRLLIRRPRKEPNLVVLNEDDFKEMNRLITYYRNLCEITNNNTPKKREIIGLAKGKILYPDNFDDLDYEIAESFYANKDSLL